MKLGHLLDSWRGDQVVGEQGNVLDIGCGGGCRIGPGPTPYGIEISKALAKQALPHFRARGGVVVHAPAIDALDAFRPEFFDGILMRSYLEHETRPRAVLSKAFSRLKAGGAIYAKLPNFGSLNRRIMGANWCGWRFPDHVNYFTERSLRSLAESVGYSYRRINWLAPLDDNIMAVLTKPAHPQLNSRQS